MTSSHTHTKMKNETDSKRNRTHNSDQTILEPACQKRQNLICKEHVCSSYPRRPCLPLLCAFKAAGAATNLNILPRFKRWNTQQTLTLKANNNWFHFNLVLAKLIVLDLPFWLKTEVRKMFVIQADLRLLLKVKPANSFYFYSLYQKTTQSIYNNWIKIHFSLWPVGVWH